MTLRRGFKAEAAELAAEVRAELQLGTRDRLDPLQLARHLDIPVVRLSVLLSSSRGAHYLLTEDPESFSGLTVLRGCYRMIYYNDSHSPARQNSDLAHELAHALLLHEPAPALDVGTGRRLWNATKEREASWLGGELLVTREMALAVARGEVSSQGAIERLAVSKRMLRWRLDVTGASKQAARERKKRTAT